MRKIVAIFAALAAMAVVGIAQSSISDVAGRDQLFGGGRLVFDFDPGPGELLLPRDLGVNAGGLDGRRVSGTQFYGNPNGGQSAPPTSVSCLQVEGTAAVIGGVTNAGDPFVQYFDDRGTPGPDPPDGITPRLTMTPEEVEEFMPRGFPRVCPAATPPAAWGNVWTTLESGDIAVVDG